MTIFVRAELRIRPGRRDHFLDAARALQAAAAGEDGTLRYAWYASDDPDLVVALEEYVDPSAAVAHNEGCAALLASAFDAADLVALHLHGDLGPDFLAWAAELATAHAYPPLFAGDG